MFVIKNIQVFEPVVFASVLAEKMPEVEVEHIDEFGDFDESEEFDFEVEHDGITIQVYGTLRAQGYSVVTSSVDRDLPPDHDFKKVTEVQEIEFFIDGEPIEVENEYDLINEINRML